MPDRFFPSLQIVPTMWYGHLVVPVDMHALLWRPAHNIGQYGEHRVDTSHLCTLQYK